MFLIAKPSTQAVNYWRDDECAKAFGSQYEMPPYQELLADTGAWLDPRPGQRWLDLGCGSGQLSRLVWTKSAGRIDEIVGSDVAAMNAQSFEKLQRCLQPPPGKHLQYRQCDFSDGLSWCSDNAFNGVVSGLAIQYAESFSETEQRWTDEGFDRLLGEIHRVLAPGGAFVFSTMVPKPKMLPLTFASLAGVWRSKRKTRYLLKLAGMWTYAGWLKREAAKGRFHYLSHEVLTQKLSNAGFVAIEHCRSYANQAYIFRCRKA